MEALGMPNVRSLQLITSSFDLFEPLIDVSNRHTNFVDTCVQIPGYFSNFSNSAQIILSASPTIP